MNFGTWIVIAFILFTLFIASLVVLSVRQNISLVAKDYYEKEQKHQQKMNYAKNTSELEHPPKIVFVGNDIQVSFALFNQLENGKLQLLRPSDSRLDQAFHIKPSSDTTQYFPLSVWSRGLYRVSMQWSMQGKIFYFEKPIVL